MPSTPGLLLHMLTQTCSIFANMQQCSTPAGSEEATPATLPPIASQAVRCCWPAARPANTQQQLAGHSNTLHFCSSAHKLSTSCKSARKKHTACMLPPSSNRIPLHGKPASTGAHSPRMQHIATCRRYASHAQLPQTIVVAAPHLVLAVADVLCEGHQGCCLCWLKAVQLLDCLLYQVVSNLQCTGAKQSLRLSAV